MSHAPLININRKNGNEKEEVDISGNEFLDQRNTEVLGYSMFNLSAADMNYYSNLLHVRSDHENFQLKFKSNYVYNYIFFGASTSLIQIIGIN